MSASSGLDEDTKLFQNQLTQIELEVSATKTLSSGKKAQLYVCLAHDWYQQDMEEKGESLLLKAEEVCPNYFGNLMGKHVEENKDFGIIVKNLTVELSYLLLNRLKDMKK